MDVELVLLDGCKVVVDSSRIVSVKSLKSARNIFRNDTDVTIKDIENSRRRYHLNVLKPSMIELIQIIQDNYNLKK